ncbi:Hypothetical protein Nlim_0890 [Candidatus Nitrosarchaeum limnium SFB1]|uniref:Uncharacterized protein n=1 Tax=Candidatus Nitrosarchaeum limnium SFB1 TaxID=886738 RepID=F3KK77_9ARCH|nr:Hypothetical protein Nlim_0890 [Candidatus Nitrosarchaeum limnium SFB1]
MRPPAAFLKRSCKAIAIPAPARPDATVICVASLLHIVIKTAKKTPIYRTEISLEIEYFVFLSCIFLESLSCRIILKTR